MITLRMTKEFSYLVKNFSCGNKYLDSYVKSSDAYNSQTGITYVMLTDNSEVSGYYTLSANNVDVIDSNIRIRVGGSVHIEYFAVDTKWQDTIINGEANTYVSEWLIQDCISRAYNLRDHIGLSFITLNSTKEGESFYEINGFDYLEEDMVISLGDSEKGCSSMYYALDEE